MVILTDSHWSFLVYVCDIPPFSVLVDAEFLQPEIPSADDDLLYCLLLIELRAITSRAWKLQHPQNKFTTQHKYNYWGCLFNAAEKSHNGVIHCSNSSSSRAKSFLLCAVNSLFLWSYCTPHTHTHAVMVLSFFHRLSQRTSKSSPTQLS